MKQMKLCKGKERILSLDYYPGGILEHAVLTSIQGELVINSFCKILVRETQVPNKGNTRECVYGKCRASTYVTDNGNREGRKKRYRRSRKPWAFLTNYAGIYSLFSFSFSTMQYNRYCNCDRNIAIRPCPQMVILPKTLHWIESFHSAETLCTDTSKSEYEIWEELHGMTGF